MNKIKEWFLQLWITIMKTYAEDQITKLMNDFQEVYYEYECYKKLYNIILILWLVKGTNTPEIKIVHETLRSIIIQFKDDTGAEIQLPVTENFGIFKNFIATKQSESKVNLKDFNTNAHKFKQFALRGILDEFGK
jgi:hypothetical protein